MSPYFCLVVNLLQSSFGHCAKVDVLWDNVRPCILNMYRTAYKSHEEQPASDFLSSVANLWKNIRSALFHVIKTNGGSIPSEDMK